MAQTVATKEIHQNTFLLRSKILRMEIQIGNVELNQLKKRAPAEYEALEAEVTDFLRLADTSFEKEDFNAAIEILLQAEVRSHSRHAEEIVNGKNRISAVTRTTPKFPKDETETRHNSIHTPGVREKATVFGNEDDDIKSLKVLKTSIEQKRLEKAKRWLEKATRLVYKDEHKKILEVLKIQYEELILEVNQPKLIDVELRNDVIETINNDINTNNETSDAIIRKEAIQISNEASNITKDVSHSNFAENTSLNITNSVVPTLLRTDLEELTPPKRMKKEHSKDGIQRNNYSQMEEMTTIILTSPGYMVNPDFDPIIESYHHLVSEQKRKEEETKLNVLPIDTNTGFNISNNEGTKKSDKINAKNDFKIFMDFGTMEPNLELKRFKHRENRTERKDENQRNTIRNASTTGQRTRRGYIEKDIYKHKLSHSKTMKICMISMVCVTIVPIFVYTIYKILRK